MVLLQGQPEPARRADCAYVDLGESARLALMLAPLRRGSFSDQAAEVLERLARHLKSQPQGMTVTSQTVFLRSPAEQPECDRLLRAFYRDAMPVTNYVLQAPCCGAALALEAWAIGGDSVRIEHFGPYATAVTYDSVRWVYCAGIQPDPAIKDCYGQGISALEQLRANLVRAGSGMEHVVRTWIYLGAITESEGEHQRYHELNRARADFYKGIRFCCSLLDPDSPRGVYPASTGIGMNQSGLVVSCLSLQTKRDDVLLLPLENPQQTPAYAYHPRYSPRSPKFSRAVALGLGDYVTTWISGTASIVDSETRYAGDIEKQTQQTIDNIERLIAPENLALHGFKGGGAGLRDLAKIRVYIKRQDLFQKCKAVCESRFGPVPAVYAVADVCRPELLVEIEGVAFARLNKQPLV